ncbi:MAG: DPP IV N-terminal domain-containing protein [Saprospiraceae bacterium]|nr:DPP IV N-terminal domain-containing protein [Saprospiraceae bacterium]
MFKTKYFPIVLVLLLSLAIDANAQTKEISMEDAILKGRTALAPENLKQLQWITQTHNFSYVFNNKIIVTNAEQLKSDTLDILPSINAKLKENKSEELAGMPGISWLDKDNIKFSANNNLYTFNIKDATLTTKVTFPASAANADVHPKSYAVAYTQDGGLFIRQADGADINVATSEAKGVVYGLAVHRNEFGIDKGTFWSESGNKLAFYRMDESDVTEYPIYVLDSMPAQARMIRYPFAGATSHYVTLGVYDLKSKKTVYLKTGTPKDQYLTSITWSSDDKFILVGVLNRDQNYLQLNCYKTSDGSLVNTLFEEKSEKYVEPEHPAIFIPNTNSEFLWYSERNGFDHLYRYDLTGKLLGEIHPGNFPITSFLGFSSNNKNIYFTSADESGLNRYTWKAEINNGKCSKLQMNEGVHNALISSDGLLLLDNWTRLDIPRKIDIISTEKNLAVKNYFTAKNPLQGYAVGTTNLITLKADDNTLLNARIILPSTLDVNKKYPSIIYVYNGPHVQMVTNSWLAGGELWMHRLAEEGYIIFVLDGRGSDNRGFDFESATFRHLGDNEMADQMQGVKYLKSIPYIDSTRIGVYGWSFGGFMTTSLMTRQDGAFKVGVAGGPVINWAMYEIMYTERYMDSPQTNQEGFDVSNLLNHAKDLKGRLMLIHGTDDDVVLWQHSLLFIRKCVELGKPIDYFVYPGHFHNVLGKDRVHLFNKIERYFIDNL